MGSDAFKDSDLDDLIRDLNGSISTLSATLEEFDKALDEWIEIADGIPMEAARGRLSVLLNGFSGTLLELSLAKASARLESIVMEEIKIQPYEAAGIASEIGWTGRTIVQGWSMCVEETPILPKMTSGLISM